MTRLHAFPGLAHVLCGSLVVLLAAGTYVWWIHNYFVADSWALLGSISASDWSLADLLPFRQVPHRINSTNYYAPVEAIVLWLGWKGGGYSPELYHLTLVAFHVGASLSLYAAVVQLAGSRLKATAAAAIFAVHFANTEGVGWIGGVSHPVAGFFGVLAMALYARHLATHARAWLVGSLVALLAAALTQVTALPWFAILVLLDVLYSRQQGSFREDSAVPNRRSFASLSMTSGRRAPENVIPDIWRRRRLPKLRMTSISLSMTSGRRAPENVIRDIWRRRRLPKLRMTPVFTRLAALGILLAGVVAVELPAVRLSDGGGYSYHLGVATIRNLFHYPVSTVLPSLEGPSYGLARDLYLAPVDRDALARLLAMSDAYAILLAGGLALIAAVLFWTTGGWLGRFALAAFALAISPAIPLEGQGYRYLYAPLMFFSIGFANALVDLARGLRGRSRVAHAALVAILPLLLVLSFAESQRQLFWWQQAGLVAHNSLQQLQRDEPRFPPGAKVVIGGALDTLPGTNAQVWRNGLSEAIQVIYGDRTLKVEGYSRAEVERLFQEDLKGAPNTFGFLWDEWGFRRIPSGR